MAVLSFHSIASLSTKPLPKLFPTASNSQSLLPKTLISLKFPTPSQFRSISTTRSPTLRRPRPSTVRCLFTGIVEEVGKIDRIDDAGDEGVHLKVRARTVLEGVHLGDSIAVNGTCLTVTEFTGEDFTAGLAPETLRKTALGELGPGSPVNLERAVLPDTRMGGHFVQGHVDGTGVIVSMEREGDSLWVKVKTEREILRYIVPKGFIAVDGTSLTVVDVSDEESYFSFMLVAYTQDNVVIPGKHVGEKVNLEVDILGKYVERLLGSGFVESIKNKAY